MASGWWNFGRRSKIPSVLEFLRFSRTNIERINDLASHQSHTEEPLNPYQCRSMSSKLLTTLENIERCLAYTWDGVKFFPTTTTFAKLSTVALENFYLVSERAKELVGSCTSKNWCQASTFQIQNEEAFMEILLETSLCYSTIYELVKDQVDPQLDLRRTSTFEPPTSAEVLQDRRVLQQRYQNFVDIESTSNSIIQTQHLAKYLLRRSRNIASQSSVDDFGSLWPDGKSPDDEWGNSDFLGGNVCKTTWIGVHCAKKVFELGVQETEILAEARILARLNHPNIVKFICCGKDSKKKWRHFIAMEQMEEGLHSVIRQQAQDKNGAPFPLRSAVDIMLQIAYGTCYLHENGIAHRDLKTCNVVVSQITTPHLKDYLQVKLVDFGLSKVKLSASRSNTISRPKIGTTVYMPPEAFHDGRANWFQADVYSFGLTCSVILSGKEPFEEIQRSKVYEAICNGDRPRLPPETPEELASLIKQCWDSNRNVRPNFVDICTRLAKMRHKLLREDPRSHMNTSEDAMEDAASLHIQEMIKKRSNSRKQKSSHFQSGELPIVIEKDERSVQNQAVEVKEDPRELRQRSSTRLRYQGRNPSSFQPREPRQMEDQASIFKEFGESVVPDKKTFNENIEPTRTLHTEDESLEYSLQYLFNDNIEPTGKQNSSSFRNPPPASFQSPSPFRRSPPPITRESMNRVSVPSTSRIYESTMPTEEEPIEHSLKFLFNDNVEPPRKNSSPFNNSSVNQAYVPSTSRAYGSTGVIPTEEEPIEHSLKFLFNDNVEPTREKSIRRSRGAVMKEEPIEHSIRLLFKEVPVVELYVPQLRDSEAKIRKCLYNIPGVEQVSCDCYNQKVTVTGNATEDTILREIMKVRRKARLYFRKQDGWGGGDMVTTGQHPAMYTSFG